MNDILFKRDIDAIIKHCCSVNGCPDLAARIDVEWDSRRFGKNPGAARISTMTVVLSERVMSTLSPKLQAEVVSRETCALIGWHLQFNKSHGGLWESLMEKAGYPHAKQRLKAFEAKQREKRSAKI